MQTKYLWALGLPTPLLTGCKGSGTTEMCGSQWQPVAQSDAPAGTTTKYLHSHAIVSGMAAAGRMKHDMSKIGEMKNRAPPPSGVNLVNKKRVTQINRATPKMQQCIQICQGGSRGGFNVKPS